MDAFADYVVVRPLGDDPAGRSWLARPPARLGLDDEQVALHLLGEASTPDHIDRLARALGAHAAVGSPKLADLHEVGEHDGRVFYSAEHHRSGSLAQPSRPLSREEVLFAVADAAVGAHHLHEAGLTHGNIRPNNMMLTEDGAKLAEPGAAVLEPGQLTTGERALPGGSGLLATLSPEVLRGEGTSRATDIWALGVSLHLVLTGHSVFAKAPEAPVVEILRHTLSHQPVLGEPLSEAESEILLSTLAADPAQRPGTAAELAERIRAEAQHQRQAIERS